MSSTYLQFRKQLDDEERPRKFTFLHGDQPVLVEEAVDLVRGLAGAEVQDRVSVSADRVWVEGAQYALPPTATRLVSCRDGQAVAWDPFPDWLAGVRWAPVHVLVVASGTPVLPDEVCAKFRSHSVADVDCSLPKTDPEKFVVSLLQDWWLRRVVDGPPLITTDTAKFLWHRTGHDLRRVKDVLAWAKVLGRKVDRVLVEKLAVPGADDRYIESLVRCETGTAASYAAVASPRLVLPVLARRLEGLDRLHRVQPGVLLKFPVRSKDSWQAIISAATRASGLPRVTVLQEWGHAGAYDPDSIRRRADLLAWAMAVQDRTGVLEVVAARW